MKSSLSAGIIISILGFGTADIAPQAPVEQNEVVETFTFTRPVIEEEKEEIEPPSPSVGSATDCSCVLTAKSLGVNIPSGHNAIDLVPNMDAPKVGELALFNYHGIGHVGTITSIEEKGFWIYEGNYKRCQTGVRFIAFDYYALIGYWSDDIYWGLH